MHHVGEMPAAPFSRLSAKLAKSNPRAEFDAGVPVHVNLIRQFEFGAAMRCCRPFCIMRSAMMGGLELVAQACAVVTNHIYFAAALSKLPGKPHGEMLGSAAIRIKMLNDQCNIHTRLCLITPREPELHCLCIASRTDCVVKLRMQR